jgi:hypothetical protein
MFTDFAKLVPFRDAKRGEDLDWTIRLSQTGFLKNEYRSDESRIHYLYQLGSRTVSPQVLEFQKTATYESMLKSVWIPAQQTPPSAKNNGFRLTGRGFVSK